MSGFLLPLPRLVGGRRRTRPARVPAGGHRVNVTAATVGYWGPITEFTARCTCRWEGDTNTNEVDYGGLKDALLEAAAHRRRTGHRLGTLVCSDRFWGEGPAPWATAVSPATNAGTAAAAWMLTAQPEHHGDRKSDDVWDAFVRDLT